MFIWSYDGSIVVVCDAEDHRRTALFEITRRMEEQNIRGCLLSSTLMAVAVTLVQRSSGLCLVSCPASVAPVVVAVSHTFNLSRPVVTRSGRRSRPRRAGRNPLSRSTTSAVVVDVIQSSHQMMCPAPPDQPRARQWTSLPLSIISLLQNGDDESREWKTREKEIMESKHFNNIWLNVLYVNSERAMLLLCRQSVVLHTGFSRVFHPCIFHAPAFFHSCVFSRLFGIIATAHLTSSVRIDPISVCT